MKNRLDYTKVLLKAQKYLSDGILVFDAKKKNIPLVFVNKSIKKILGYSNAEIIGKSYKFFEGDDTDKENIEKYRQCFSNKHNYTADLIIKKKNGEKIYCRISISPIPDSNGRTDSYVCILRNITDSREKLINKLKLSIVESTLHTINDTVFNYMNAIQLFRMDCEEHVGPNKIKFDEWDKNHSYVLNRLKKINELREVKEKKLFDKFSIIVVSN